LFDSISQGQEILGGEREDPSVIIERISRREGKIVMKRSPNFEKLEGDRGI